MAASEEKRDKRFPLFVNDNPIGRLLICPRRLVAPYVIKGQVAADLGCGSGHFTLALADFFGPEGRVYTVDSDEKAIRALERKAAGCGYRHIEAIT